MDTPSAPTAHFPTAQLHEARPGKAFYILWGRPVFRAPPLHNPQPACEPPCLRGCFSADPRLSGTVAGRQLSAA